MSRDCCRRSTTINLKQQGQPKEEKEKMENALKEVGAIGTCYELREIEKQCEKMRANVRSERINNLY